MLNSMLVETFSHARENSFRCLYITERIKDINETNQESLHQLDQDSPSFFQMNVASWTRTSRSNTMVTKQSIISSIILCTHVSSALAELLFPSHILLQAEVEIHEVATLVMMMAGLKMKLLQSCQHLFLPCVYI